MRDAEYMLKASQKHRAKKRAAGECMYNGCHLPRTGKQYCDEHRRKAAIAEAANRMRHRSVGQLKSLQQTYRSRLRAIDAELRKRAVR
jgi:hypothetical protein